MGQRYWQHDVTCNRWRQVGRRTVIIRTTPTAENPAISWSHPFGHWAFRPRGEASSSSFAGASSSASACHDKSELIARQRQSRRRESTPQLGENWAKCRGRLVASCTCSWRRIYCPYNGHCFRCCSCSQCTSAVADMTHCDTAITLILICRFIPRALTPLNEQFAQF